VRDRLVTAVPVVLAQGMALVVAVAEQEIQRAVLLVAQAAQVVRAL
jgi:hypothetical protein